MVSLGSSKHQVKNNPFIVDGSFDVLIGNYFPIEDKFWLFPNNYALCFRQGIIDKTPFDTKITCTNALAGRYVVLRRHSEKKEFVVKKIEVYGESRPGGYDFFSSGKSKMTECIPSSLVNLQLQALNLLSDYSVCQCFVGGYCSWMFSCSKLLKFKILHYDIIESDRMSVSGYP